MGDRKGRKEGDERRGEEAMKTIFSHRRKRRESRVPPQSPHDLPGFWATDPEC
jgi:hypothetical protein